MAHLLHSFLFVYRAFDAKKKEEEGNRGKRFLTRQL